MDLSHLYCVLGAWQVVGFQEELPQHLFWLHQFVSGDISYKALKADDSQIGTHLSSCSHGREPRG